MASTSNSTSGVQTSSDQNDEAIDAQSCYTQRAIAVLQRFRILRKPSPPKMFFGNIQSPSEKRRLESLAETPLRIHSTDERNMTTEVDGQHPTTILYLAYGSNLSAETFLGKRGIRPISQANVVVPELVLTFDLPGIPYIEPCFANTKYRYPPSERESRPPPTTTLSDSEKDPLLQSKNTYHKDRWHKGLVGVVYEVTPKDFAHIIATEGGGSAYEDVLTDCYEVPPGISTVPEPPTSRPFKAHTLCSPAQPPTDPEDPHPPPEKRRRVIRPDPSYAQPSARYLKLLTDGAKEHSLPDEYIRYLHSLHPYTITSAKQRLGKWIFLLIWLPIFQFIFGVGAMFANDKGRSPPWLADFSAAAFRAVWGSYDGFFKGTFGDGERTQDGKEEDKEEDKEEGKEREEADTDGLRVKDGAANVKAREYGAV